MKKAILNWDDSGDDWDLTSSASNSKNSSLIIQLFDESGVFIKTVSFCGGEPSTDYLDACEANKITFDD